MVNARAGAQEQIMGRANKAVAVRMNTSAKMSRARYLDRVLFYFIIKQTFFFSNRDTVKQYYHSSACRCIDIRICIDIVGGGGECGSNFPSCI